MKTVLDPATGKPLDLDSLRRVSQLARELKPGDKIISIAGHITTEFTWNAAVADVKRVSDAKTELTEL